MMKLLQQLLAYYKMLTLKQLLRRSICVFEYYWKI